MLVGNASSQRHSISTMSFVLMRVMSVTKPLSSSGDVDQSDCLDMNFGFVGVVPVGDMMQMV